VSPAPVSCPHCGAKINAAHSRCPRCRVVVAAATQPEEAAGGRHYAIASAVLVGVFVLVLAWLWYNSEPATDAHAFTRPAVVAASRPSPFQVVSASPNFPA
jgi:hypothetical protein